MIVDKAALYRYTEYAISTYNTLYYILAEGYCKGVKCADNSECVDGHCVCRGGHVGDGHHKCQRK